MALEFEHLFDIRYVGRTHPKADLSCERCCGRAWTIIMADKGQQVLTIQKCDTCNLYFDDVSAAAEANKYGLQVRLEFPCYITNHPFFHSLSEKDEKHTAGLWYHRYLQPPYLLLSEVFDDQNKPVTRINVTQAERIVSGVNAKIVLHKFFKSRDQRFIRKDLADALERVGVTFEKEKDRAT